MQKTLNSEKLSASKLRRRSIAEEFSSVYNSCDVSVFVFSYTGLTATKTQELRFALSDVGAKMKIIKNTLNSFAIKNSGFVGLSSFFSGQIAVAFGSDLVGIAKVLKKFDNNKNIALLACSDGKNVYEKKEIQDIASLPSLEGLRSSLLSVLLSIPSKLVNVLSEPSRSLARVLDQRTKSENV